MTHDQLRIGMAQMKRLGHDEVIHHTQDHDDV